MAVIERDDEKTGPCIHCGERVKRGAQWFLIGEGSVYVCGKQECIEAALHFVLDSLFSTRWRDMRESRRELAEWLQLCERIFWMKHAMRWESPRNQYWNYSVEFKKALEEIKKFEIDPGGLEKEA